MKKLKPLFVHRPVRIRGQSRFATPAPTRAGFHSDQPERMLGVVQDKQASEPEEQLARALERAGRQYIFRYVFGAPRYAPGWKELDFIVLSDLVYLVEVDTPFTHRGKAQKDILHDAMALNDSGIKRLGTVFPQVLHVNGNEDLVDSRTSDNWVRSYL